MRWTTHGERTLYDSEWVRLTLVDVELPDGQRFDHHVVRAPRHATGVVVHDPERGVLVLHRHRFVTDTWGWEIPAGAIDHDESVATAARREVLEETGWEPHDLAPLVTYHPSNGLSDQRFHTFLAHGATYVGEPTDSHEADRVEWVAVDEVRRLVEGGEVLDGMSLTALSFALATGRLG